MPFYTPNTTPSEIDLRLLDYLRREFQAVGQGQDILREQYEDVIHTHLQTGESAQFISHDHSRLLLDRARGQQVNLIDYRVTGRFVAPDVGQNADIIIRFLFPDTTWVQTFQTLTHMDPLTTRREDADTVLLGKLGETTTATGDLHAVCCEAPDTGSWAFQFTSRWFTNFGGTFSHTLVSGTFSQSFPTFPVKILLIGSYAGQYDDTTYMSSYVTMRDADTKGQVT